jgi:Phage integrase family
MAGPERPWMGPRIGMPQRSDRPGLKFRGTKTGQQPYWVAKQVVRDIMGFPDKTIRLPMGASDEELAALCRDHTARLLAWIAEAANERVTYTRYDGTVLTLSRVYQEHPDSPFHELKHNTRKTYTDSLKVIEATIGKRLVRNLSVIDVRRYYKNWRRPKFADGAERIDRAHDAVAMFRTILRFGFALGHDECGRLDERLKTQRFEKGGAREEQMTYIQAAAFVRIALQLGATGVIPLERGRCMAIGVAAQFELTLRQKDIIGDWQPAIANVPHAIYAGGEMWVGAFRWDNIPGWRFRLKTSKTRAATGFSLTDYPLLFPLLEGVAQSERTGAIIKGERGLPVRERSYRKWFRQIARAAGIPDEVWSMDSRAGGATEADEAGVEFQMIQELLTHSEPKTTVRYLRRREKRISDIAKARVEHREKSHENDG